MSKLRNFINKIAKNNTVFTAEDVGAMSKTDFDTNHDAIMYQMNTIGLPRRENLAGNPDVIYVEAYTRKDGTHVRGYYRSVSGGAASIEDFDAEDYENTMLQGSVEYEGYIDEYPPETPNLEVEKNSPVSPAQSNSSTIDYFSDDMNTSSVMYNDYLYNQLLNNPVDDLVSQYTSEGNVDNIESSINQLLNKGRLVLDQIPQEYINNMMDVASSIYLQPITNLVFPVAGDNLINSRYRLANSRMDKNSRIFESRNQLNDLELNNLMDSLKIPRESAGVVHTASSKVSKRLWKSKEIQNIVKNYENELKVNNNSGIFDIEFTMQNSLDNYFGIQHCKLYNPHITKDGYFEGKIIDYYDFDYRTPNSFGSKINNWGALNQKNGKLQNFYTIYEIREKIK